LEDVARDGRVADLDDIGGDPFDLDPLVGGVEGLLQGTGHGLAIVAVA